MSTNYNGQSITAQVPSPAMRARILPVTVLPQDSDPFNAAAFSQQHKMIADNSYYAANRLLYDHFLGQTTATGLWLTPIVAGAGTVSTGEDVANGASGIVALNSGAGGSATLQCQQLALGTTDFKMYFRVRVSGVTATSSLSFGLVSGAGSAELRFYVQGSVSTTNWRVAVDSVPTAPNGTPAAISASYADFVISRQSNVAIFSVNGTTLHTVNPYSTSANTGFVRLSASTAGIINCDVAELVANI